VVAKFVDAFPLPPTIGFSAVDQPRPVALGGRAKYNNNL